MSMPLLYKDVKRLREVIYDSFTVMDIAEPLRSFDLNTPAIDAYACLEEAGAQIGGIREHGRVIGYIQRAELTSGSCLDHMHTFAATSVVPETASLLAAFKTLEQSGFCFVSVLGEVSAAISLQDLEKPPVRMFLFGLLSLTEVLVVRDIRTRYPDDSWTSLISPGRLEKARALQQERVHRGMPADLLSCLQFSDKLELLSRNPETLKNLGQPSRKAALQAIKELENLRNNLAHSQSIITPEWQRIVIFSSNMHCILERMEDSHQHGL